MKTFLAMLCAIFWLNTVVFSQSIPSLSPSLEALKPENILLPGSQTNYVFSDSQKDVKPSLFTVSMKDDIPFFTAEVFSKSNVQTTWKCTSAVKRGDVVLVRFAMRAVYAKQESGEGVVYIYVQQSNSDRFVNIQLGAGQDWKVFDVPLVINRDINPGETEVTLTFGQLAQKIEITGLQVLNFGKKATLAQLPTTRFSYAGREANAPWRNAALQRIEEIRTAPLVIQIEDAKGNPVEGATVKAQLVDPEFIFGTAVSANLLANETLPDSEIYRKKLLELFNAVTIDNGLKWPSWINPKSQEKTRQAVDWITTNGLRLRGHNLVWPGKKFTPGIYAQQPNFGPGFSDSITKHIEEIATFTKGRVYGWDVINEMMHEKDYFEVMPRTQAVKWFQQARRIDPQATLYINEYSMLNGIASAQNIKKYLELIAELRDGGAPIDAIGVQGHVGRQPRNPEQVLTDLDLFVPTGLPVQITEFDINSPDDELQADYTRDFLIACYSHPIVNGFTMWGFWEGAHWKPDAALFRRDWTAKPNEAVWREWVLGKWRTSISETTAKTGKIESKGHFGKYEITVTKGKKTKTVVYQFTNNIEPIVVRL